MRIETCTPAALEEWVTLRQALWSYPEAELRAEAVRALSNPDAICLLARDDGGVAAGFAEGTIRRDHVNGCDTSPVGFLEGLYVREEWRRRGVARQLCHAIESWVTAQGCSELASDTWLEAVESQRVHNALGFSETERVVYFRKRLGPVQT